ncbi:E3 ubiquitin-protein ligase rififylin [Pelobates fuscus]|uniref:E3 ubiquitin-protein ligase rififylin n=1 Tax=Pelobates fuscus TaxID=191477 RepID=UPI002FE49B18
MWAACCNWLCLDSQPEDTIPSGRTQASSNPNVRPPSTIPNITCRACGTQLPIRKSPCMDCMNNFCGSCFSQVNGSQPICQLCWKFRSTFFSREELLKMKVKDLRDYLSMRGISTDLCREKDDLIQLVLNQRPTVNHTDIPSSDIPQFTSNQNRADHDEGPAPSQQPQTENSSTTPSEDGEDLMAEQETESLDSEEVLVPGRRASLSDIHSVEEIEDLTVRQLKEILARNFVNYKGCCEKWELMERVTRLYTEQKGLQEKVAVAEGGGNPGAALDDHICKVCMDSPIDCVLLECGHMVTCTKCGKRMSECPICRQYVVRAVHVFRS